MKRFRFGRTAAIASVCAVAGAAAGIAGSAAAPSSHKAYTTESGFAVAGPPGGVAIRFAGSGPPVHSDLVVPNQAGTGFDTITTDDGQFKSVSGDQLTITEGTKTVTYKDVTLTIPAGAKVYRNGSSAHLSDLRSGDEVHVVQGPKGTMVDAADAQHQASGRFGPFSLHKMPPPPGASTDMAPPPPGP
ncbi:MAG TPA: hypothetical protein VGY97_07130 [Solirubrobacteraceae bacterium]|jgi:hypothetical protein|nr:hypothetical protein [Solirubrobacteraceae bacterium]